MKISQFRFSSNRSAAVWQHETAFGFFTRQSQRQPSARKPSTYDTSRKYRAFVSTYCVTLIHCYTDVDINNYFQLIKRTVNYIEFKAQ